jgi:hypothetical protein
LEIIMNVKQILSLSLIALASSAAMADGGDIGVSNYPTNNGSTVARATVKAGVISARASGELREAGEAGDTPYAFQIPTTSDVSRADVKLATLQAAKAGLLAPAGVEYSERPTGESTPHAKNDSGRNFASAIASKFRSN